MIKISLFTFIEWVSVLKITKLNRLIFIFCYLGCPEMARQKILSILHHVSNQHQFPSFTLFPECAHGPLEQERPWIATGSFSTILTNERGLGFRINIVIAADESFYKYIQEHVKKCNFPSSPL